LSKHDIRLLVQKKQKETGERLQIRRDDVILGLQDAYDRARLQSDPMGMLDITLQQTFSDSNCSVI